MTNLEKEIVDKVLDIMQSAENRTVQGGMRLAVHAEVEKLVASHREADTKQMSFAQPLAKPPEKATDPQPSNPPSTKYPVTEPAAERFSPEPATPETYQDRKPV